MCLAAGTTIFYVVVDACRSSISAAVCRAQSCTNNRQIGLWGRHGDDGGGFEDGDDYDAEHHFADDVDGEGCGDCDAGFGESGDGGGGGDGGMFIDDDDDDGGGDDDVRAAADDADCNSDDADCDDVDAGDDDG